VGNIIHVQPGSGVSVGKLSFNGPKTGEIDVYIAVEDPHGIDVDEAFNVLSPYLASILFQMAVMTGDFFLPTAPPFALQKLDDNSTKQSSGLDLSIMITSRSHVTETCIMTSLSTTSITLQQTSGEPSLYSIMSAKRMQSAQIETDPVDEYCDYWEACEFITQARHSNVKNRIINNLTAITLYKRRILEKCLVDPLYDIRCNIVHNAVEDLARIKRALPLLIAVANVLRGGASGATYQNVGILAEFYQSINERRETKI